MRRRTGALAGGSGEASGSSRRHQASVRKGSAWGAAAGRGLAERAARRHLFAGGTEARLSATQQQGTEQGEAPPATKGRRGQVRHP